MPKNIKQLSARDHKLIAYDDIKKEWFLVSLIPATLDALEKDEIIEAVDMALMKSAPDAVIN
jgi:hypothetical protein